MVTALIVLVVGLILTFDPPPFLLQQPNEFALSVPPPAAGGRSDPIESGLACVLKLEGGISNIWGRPIITIFDWLKKQSGRVQPKDVQLYGSKRNDAWAIKVDRATKSFCIQKAKNVEVGLTDPYCGPKIIHENSNRIVAIEDNDYTAVTTIVFDKQTNNASIAQVARASFGPQAFSIWSAASA